MRAEIDPFHAIGVSHLAHQLKAEGASIIHMEFGQPSTGAPAAAIAVAHKVLDTEAMGYWESPQLRARIARHYGEKYGLDVEPGRILLTCGASPALLLALISSFEPGERVALARPGYVAYRNTLKALHLVPVEIACGPESRFQLTAAHLAALDPAPAGVIVASPANPTGTIIDAVEMAAIAAICAERDIRIISDEIYHGISYVEPARSMLEFAPDALVINSFSKYFSMAGWRLGWLLSPAAHAPRPRAYASNLFLTPPSLSQHAALAAMDARDELEAHVAVYRRNRALLLEALPKLGLRAIAPPDGAFYIYADIGHLTDDSLAFCKQLLRDTGVATAPGIDFDPVDGRRFIRFSFAVSTPEVEEALRRLKPWFAARRLSAGARSGAAGAPTGPRTP
jgi:aspartate/methionine/tyrosine aminotransferase